VRKEGAGQSHRDFRVRRSIVQCALQWLVTHNKYYHANHVHIDVSALEHLPEDGNISQQLTAITVESCATDDPVAIAPTTDSHANSDTSDPYNAHLPQSFVPVATQSVTEQEAVQQSVEQRQSSSSSSATMMWPSIGGMPINEFTTEGYFSCAFPTLFPTGAGDFLGQRQIQVTIGNYFKHLMMYDDSRFAKHPRFRFFALNTEMRWRALQTGRVYVKQHPGDAQLSLDELRDIWLGDEERLSPAVWCTMPLVHEVIKQYWYRQQS
jgi:hypothetical protein